MRCSPTTATTSPSSSNRLLRRTSTRFVLQRCVLYDLIVVPQEHKCVECGKMLGNNKRRLLHFGVHHAHVLPLVSSHLRSLGPQEEEREEDGFEVTLDPVVDSPVKAKEPKVVKETKIVRKASGTPRTCEICGVKRNTNANLLRHYSREHFVLEIEEGYGHLMVGATCSLCHTVVDCTARGVGDAEKWVHLGVRHGVTNTLLQQQGWNPVHLRDKQENGTVATPAPALVATNGLSNPKALPSPSPPPPPPESPELFSCDLCDKKTKNQNLLNLHLIAMHYKKEILASYGNPEHQCKVCRKILPNSDAFAFHIGQDHNRLTEFVKKNPGKAKVTNGELVNGEAGGQHVVTGEVHSAVEKYLPVENHIPSPSTSPTTSIPKKTLLCPLKCSINFITEQQLTDHFRVQHGFSQVGLPSSLLSTFPHCSHFQEVVQKMRDRNFAVKTKDSG